MTKWFLGVKVTFSPFVYLNEFIQLVDTMKLGWFIVHINVVHTCIRTYFRISKMSLSEEFV